MASLLAHPLTDEVHFWNTRWRTRVDHEQRADVMDALQARPLPPPQRPQACKWARGPRVLRKALPCAGPRRSVAAQHAAT